MCLVVDKASEYDQKKGKIDLKPDKTLYNSSKRLSESIAKRYYITKAGPATKVPHTIGATMNNKSTTTEPSL